MTVPVAGTVPMRSRYPGTALREIDKLFKIESEYG